jgi:NAD(P)H-hydrate epimerase
MNARDPRSAYPEIPPRTPAERFTPVQAEQLVIARQLAVGIREGIDSLGEPELVLDAPLGYSQRGKPHGQAANLIRWSAGRRVLALDVPSGLELATGRPHTPHVSAEASVERRGVRSCGRR